MTSTFDLKIKAEVKMAELLEWKRNWCETVKLGNQYKTTIKVYYIILFSIDMLKYSNEVPACIFEVFIDGE